MAEIKWIKKAFAWGLIDDVGVYNFPVNYSSYLRNIRIVNDSLVVAPGFYTVYDGETSARIQDMTSVDGKLFAVYNRELYEIDLAAWTETDRSSSPITASDRIRLLGYGRVVIVLTGAGYPFIWNIGAGTWTQLDATKIDNSANPRFGEVYLHLTFVAGGWDNENALWISRGITAANPEYAYDWDGTGSEKLIFDSKIQAIKATEQRLYVFTEKSIAYIDEAALQGVSIGGATATFPKIVSKYNAPASNEAVVAAHDRMFAFTKDRNIVEINRAGINDIEVANISDIEGVSIRWFLQTLDEDQSTCVGYFNAEENLIVWCLKTEWSPINNINLIYDLNYNTFLVDDNKFFGASCFHNNKLYTGSFTSAIIYREGEFWDYDGDSIPWERVIETDLEAPEMRKMFTDIAIAWEHNGLSTIYIDVEVDGESAGWPFLIAGSSVISWGMWTFPIGQMPIAGEVEQVGLEKFMKTIWQGDIRSKGTTIKIRLYGESFGARTVISKLGIGATNAGKSLRDTRI